MGDPGLHSKFIEMQQEEAFAPRHRAAVPNAYIEGLKMDRARIVAQLRKAVHVNHVAILRLALAAIDEKLNLKV